MEQAVINTNTHFREDEITIIRDNVYPKVAGRLRLAHEHNEHLSISTEVIRYDESIAVVRATCTTSKGTFSGIGMASMDRDRKIAPAILELAETRSIARALRFSGYGLEHSGAEEVSHNNGTNGGHLFSLKHRQFSIRDILFSPRKIPRQTPASLKATVTAVSQANSTNTSSHCLAIPAEAKRIWMTTACGPMEQRFSTCQSRMHPV